MQRPCGIGLGLVNPSPGYLPLLSDLCGSLPGPFAPLPIPGPWTGRLFRAGLGVVVPDLWAAIQGGPSCGKVTVGEGVSMIWAVALLTLPLILSRGCLQVLDRHRVRISSPCDFVFQSLLFGITGDEERSVSALPPAVMGLGSAVSPQSWSLTHLLFLLPAEGEVRRRGSGTLPSGPARLKSRSKGSDRALWPLA